MSLHFVGTRTAAHKERAGFPSEAHNVATKEGTPVLLVGSLTDHTPAVAAFKPH